MLSFPQLQQSVGDAKPDHGHAYRGRNRGEEGELRGQKDHGQGLRPVLALGVVGCRSFHAKLVVVSNVADPSLCLSPALR